MSLTGHLIFAVVYNPYNVFHQHLIGRFALLEKLIPSPNDVSVAITAENIRFYKFKEGSEIEMRVRIKNNQLLCAVGEDRHSNEGTLFYLTSGLNRDHPWAWLDEKGETWLTTEDFGRYLTNLKHLLIA